MQYYSQQPASFRAHPLIKWTHPDSSDLLGKSHIIILQVRVPSRVLSEYADTTVTGATAHAVAAEYPHSNLKGTPTCSNHSGTVLHETYVANLEEFGCVWWNKTHYTMLNGAFHSNVILGLYAQNN